jgi:hypothetical protein
MLAPQNPAAAAGVNAWRGAVIADMRSVVSAATIGEDVSGSPIWPVLPEVTIDERDVLLDTFGVPASDLVDASGLFSDARLLAAYRLKLPMLQEVCDRILGLIAERPPSVLSGVSCVRDIVTSPSPLMTLTTARQVRRMFLDAFSGDADRTAGVLAETWDQRDREWSTFVRLNDRLRRIESAETQREHDIALLEAYKHMVEGLTRRWAWTLLRLSGLDGRSPSVGQLIEPAVARLGLIGVWLKRSLLVIARNAEAHEDLDFDEDTGRLLVGNSTVEPQALAGFLQELDILQRGWEAGRLATVQDSPSLGAAALGRATKRSQSVALQLAKQRFGHAGQTLRSFRRDGQRVDIELEGLRANACNPCFVALTQSAAILPSVNRFVVRLANRPEPIIDLPSTVLRANWPVFLMAANLFPHALPQVTFVPCLTWVRLACEPVEQAAHVAAWMVLNDSQHAVNDAEANAEEALQLCDRLRLAAAAGEVTSALLPSGPHMRPLSRAVRIASTTADAVVHGVEGIVREVLLDRILRCRDRLGLLPAVLPTLDPSPIAESEYPHTIH